MTGVAVGPDGTLYASEMSTGNLEEPPFAVPGSGRIVHQTGPDSSEDVATGLMFPIGLAFGPDGGLYVAMPAFGADSGGGTISRIDLTGTAAATARAPLLAGRCGDAGRVTADCKGRARHRPAPLATNVHRPQRHRHRLFPPQKSRRRHEHGARHE